MNIFKIFNKNKPSASGDVYKNKKLKIGLALGGGGTKGFAHLGAIKAFEEFGIKFDHIAGTSVGSLVGALYASGKNYSELYELSKSLKVKDIKSGFSFLPSPTSGLEKLITDNISVTDIENLPLPFCAIAVDLKSTKECVFTSGPIAPAVAASCAVPGVFQPVLYNDFILADGGLQDNIPARILKMMDCDYVVSVDVNPSRGYGTDSAKILDVISCSIRILMKNTAIKGYLESDVMIKPDTKRFKSTKVESFEDMIEEGYRATIDQIPNIIKLFDSKPQKSKAKDTDEGIIII